MKQFHICSRTLHSHTKALITELTKQFQYKLIKLDLNKNCLSIFLYPNTTQEIIQLLILIAKHYTYMCRNNKCEMNV